ncbi:hypothetical protein O6P43_012821 [Quillaja saponaria]|uniref:Uncharacterized protein n=1 Tax=Quillaja saponaria TaxID=32244 RepID=A0AAD7M2I3_QUISA|nr:hypothetical protein O6P43_012821 [Quillaja saponaria]
MLAASSSNQLALKSRFKKISCCSSRDVEENGIRGSAGAFSYWGKKFKEGFSLCPMSPRMRKNKHFYTNFQ